MPVAHGRHRIGELSRDFLASAHNSLGIVLQNQKQAEKIAAALTEAGIAARLLDASSAAFVGGISVCSAHLAKGLELDRVIVPEVGAASYRTAMDRNLLYVACTRAMHRLTLTHTGEPSPLLPA